MKGAGRGLSEASVRPDAVKYRNAISILKPIDEW
jgi:hypothetical protein